MSEQASNWNVPNALTVSHEDGVEVVRVPGYVPRRPTLLRRALYELSYVAAAYRHVRAHDVDLVLACTPSLFAGWLGARIAARTVPEHSPNPTR